MGDLRQMTRAFVDLADSLVDEFDMIELLHVLTARCVEILGADAAGVMLVDPSGQLRVAAASSDRARLLELFELQNHEGPCLDCFRTALPVFHVNLGDGTAPWPRFASHAMSDGFFSAHALPMRLRQQVIGTLNLFRHDPVAMHDDDIGVAQAFADIATIAILQERLVREQTLLADQLQEALNSRVVIGQAEGILSERSGWDMETAFTRLRNAARRENRRLSDLAREVVASRGGTSLD
jgi:GAF domain-containing protein